MNPTSRMRDVEILVRFLGFSYFLSDYAGQLKNFLDTTCERLNTSWPRRSSEIEERVKSFEEAISAGTLIFGKGHVGRKWIKTGYQAQLNRAVLDAVVFYFSDQRIREASLSKQNEVENKFKEIFEEEKFRSSVEVTTKTINATITRLSMWGHALQSVIGLDFNIPELHGNRIHFDSFWE